MLDISHISVSAGRAAITLALQHAAIGAREEVLVPAYHCESMIAPVEFVGSTPVYYKVQANTSVDLADLECKITPRTRAVLATHYFGFPQDISKLRELCDKHKLVLIEDCAHAFFGSKDGFTLGTCGDYAIGSAMKFFPLFDGGILASSRHALRTIELVSPPLGLEMKAATNVVEYAMRYRRLPLLSLPLKVAVALKDFFWRIMKKTFPRGPGRSLAPPSSEGGYTLDPHWINTRMSWVSRFTLSYSKRERICTSRRANYLRIVDALKETIGIKPLFSTLPDGVVPLVAPMIVQKPLELFPKLKNAGVPIWRFGEYLYPEINASVCENSTFLSAHVFQFPCHPELSNAEIQWMVDTIKQCLSD